MSIKQVFMITHNRDSKLKPEELRAMLHANFKGVIREGKVVVVEIEKDK